MIRGPRTTIELSNRAAAPAAKDGFMNQVWDGRRRHAPGPAAPVDWSCTKRRCGEPRRNARNVAKTTPPQRREGGPCFVASATLGGRSDHGLADFACSHRSETNGAAVPVPANHQDSSGKQQAGASGRLAIPPGAATDSRTRAVRARKDDHGSRYHAPAA